MRAINLLFNGLKEGNALIVIVYIMGFICLMFALKSSVNQEDADRYREIKSKYLINSKCSNCKVELFTNGETNHADVEIVAKVVYMDAKKSYGVKKCGGE